jgi:multicomponent Na+:H+ antiporter subunit E
MSRRLLRAAVARGALLAAVWWAVSEGSGTGGRLAPVAVGLAVAASLWLQPPGGAPVPRLRALPGFTAWFVVRSTAGSVDVARRALRRPVDLQPAVIEVPIALPDGWPSVLLADAVSLMPGTLAVRRTGPVLQLHVLDETRPYASDVAELQRRVARLFGLDASHGG